MGKNDFGQLGLNKSELKVSEPKKVRIEDVKIIFAGADHCAAIKQNEDLMIWGYGLDGRLGTGYSLNSNKPVLLNLEEPVQKVACGGHHTAFLTKNGNIYMCGNGRDGELGRGDSLESHSVNRNSPRLVNYLKDQGYKVADVACGGSHTIILADKRNLI